MVGQGRKELRMSVTVWWNHLNGLSQPEKQAGHSLGDPPDPPSTPLSAWGADLHGLHQGTLTCGCQWGREKGGRGERLDKKALPPCRLCLVLVGGTAPPAVLASQVPVPPSPAGQNIPPRPALVLTIPWGSLNPEHPLHTGRSCEQAQQEGERGREKEEMGGEEERNTRSSLLGSGSSLKGSTELRGVGRGISG